MTNRVRGIWSDGDWIPPEIEGKIVAWLEADGNVSDEDARKVSIDSIRF
jgi:hypothetical protein